MNRPDDDFTDLEARLRAWRPAAMPPALLARLLAAEPRPRPRRRTLAAILWGLTAVLGLFGWRLAGDFLATRPSGGPHAARWVPAGVRLADVAWTPGADLTMNLATGVPADNMPAPWRLDGDPEAMKGLFSTGPADGKLPLKVDCQF